MSAAQSSATTTSPTTAVTSPPVFTIYLGADHRGIAKKEYIKELLLTKGQDCFLKLVKQEKLKDIKDIKIVDLGANYSRPTDDYNEFALKVAEKVSADPHSRGILICGSGHGMCIQANRIRGIRAVNPPTAESATEARAHSDANILCLAADYLTPAELASITLTFFSTQFLPERRYQRRIQRLDLDPDITPATPHHSISDSADQPELEPSEEEG